MPQLKIRVKDLHTKEFQFVTIWTANITDAESAALEKAKHLLGHDQVNLAPIAKKTK